MLTKREVAGAKKSQARAADAVQEEIPTAAAGAAATVAAVTAAGRPSHASTTDRNEPSDAGTSSDAELRGAPLISPKGTDTTDESAVGSSSAGDSQQSSTPRQVIAVSASKGPAAFFNLARKFLVTDETVDLSALEGAIVSAVDAAHLLERSKLATIVRYVKKVLFLVPLFTVVTLYLLPTCSALLLNLPSTSSNDATIPPTPYPRISVREKIL